MVQIPVFTSQSSPKVTAPVTRGVPNLVGSAMLPYEQGSRLGSTILDVGQKKYQQELNFKNEKYKAKLDHDLNLKKLALDFESEEYANQKQHEIDTFKANESYKTELFKLSNELKGDFEINKINIQRENKVKQTIADSWEQIYALSDIANRDPDTENALGNWENGIKNLKTQLTRGVTDLYTKQLIEQELDENVSLERAKVSSNINKNVLDQSEIIFQNEVETLKNNIIRNHSHFDIISLEKLIGDESIIHERAAKGELKLNGVPVTSDIYIEAVKKDIFTVMGENMAKDQPERFKFYNRQGFWDDKLTPELIQSYEDKADVAIASKLSNQISNLKSSATILTTSIDNFIDPTNPEFFGDTNQYFTYKTQAEDTINDLLAVGENEKAQKLAIKLDALNSAFVNHNEIRRLQELPLDQVQDYWAILNQDVRNKSGKEDVSLKSNLLGHVETLMNYMETEIGAGRVIEMAEKFGMNIPTINWMDTNPKEIAQYQASMGFLMNKYNLTEMPFFRESDLAQINEVFKTGSKQDILQLASNVAQVSGIYANDAFTDLSNNSPAIAHLGKLMNMNQGGMTQATEHIVNGWIAMRNDETASLVGKVGLDKLDNDYLTISETMLGDILTNVPETFTQITESSKFIFANMIAENSELRQLIIDDDGNNEKLQAAWRMSIQYASGMVIDADGAKGGIEMFNSKSIIIPKEKANGTLDQFNLAGQFKSNDAPSLELLLENHLTDELLYDATATISADASGRSEDVFLNGMPSEFNLKGEFVDYIDAKELFAGHEKIYLETNEYGEYFITFGDPGDPAHEYYKTKDGKKVTLNINRILPALIKSYNADKGMTVNILGVEQKIELE
ncbi:MAG: hypothetical protein Unbinned2350contig1001_5 [Prokaryotic dsDNA virus sp.]|nr:MAG: hypothetical protein Unbinned2350contig1001_5 [Prokaryotic dsDNA virus sp.]|tara:strand:- start:8438 stop:10996 length:2559 start_codon:yes stop_codon:yes gene_type:complete